jgi:Fur family ferric uptake transcriptional regulator
VERGRAAGYAPGLERLVRSPSDSGARRRRAPGQTLDGGVADRLARFRAALKTRGLKHSAVRDLVVEEFLQAGTHITIEDLLARVRRRAAGVGYSTVYRTLKLLVESGEAVARDFGGAQSLFEPADTRHHDHAVCVRCGAIREFEESAIETLQEKVARRLGFEVTSHRLELYGVCADCAGKRRD